MFKEGERERMSNEIAVTLPDGAVRRYPAGTTPADIARALGGRMAREAVVARVDGRLVVVSPGAVRAQGAANGVHALRARGVAPQPRPRHGPGPPATYPRGQAGHRAAHRARVLLRLRPARAADARDAGAHLGGDAPHHPG